MLGLLALEAFMLLAERFGWFTFDRHKGYAVLVTIAAVGAGLLFMVLWFLFALIFRRRFQFSLRSLMLLVVVVAIPCSWLATAMKAAREQHAAVEAIRELDRYAWHDFEMDDSGHWIVAEPPEPAWLRSLLGDDFFADVVTVELGFYVSYWTLFEPVTDTAMVHLGRLKKVRLLVLRHATISDAGLEHVKGLRELRSLDLFGTVVTDAGLEHLKGLTKTSSAGSRQHQGRRRRAGTP